MKLICLLAALPSTAPGRGWRQMERFPEDGIRLFLVLSPYARIDMDAESLRRFTQIPADPFVFLRNAQESARAPERSAGPIALDMSIEYH